MIANPYLNEHVYRITHIQNLQHILQFGICTKHHPDAGPHFTTLGNPSIISRRDTTVVRISGYGNIGEYVPFYFTPRSIMLYNIVTGYQAPIVPKVERNDIIIFHARISQLILSGQYFFTNGQANDALTDHFNDVKDLALVDWKCIKSGNFSKSEGDFDKPRRYQAEFLVRHHVPLSFLDGIVVYNHSVTTFVQDELKKAGIVLPVSVNANHFFK
jgi:hypothetical protein